jgi:hypothetical protein
MSARPPCNWEKVYNDRLGDRGSPYRWSCRLAEFFPGGFLGKSTADPKHSNSTYYTTIDAVLAKVVPFEGLIRTSDPMRSYPQNPSFWGRQWDFELRRLLAYLCTDKTFDACRDIQCAIWIIKGWGISGVKFTKVCFKAKCTAKFQSTAENFEKHFNDTRQTKSINEPPIENRSREIDRWK